MKKDYAIRVHKAVMMVRKGSENSSEMVWSTNEKILAASEKFGVSVQKIKRVIGYKLILR